MTLIGASLVVSQSPAVRVVRQADQHGSDAGLAPDKSQSLDLATPAIDPLTVLIVTPSVHAGAADAGTMQLVHILAANGHRPIVVASGGRMVPDIIAAGAQFVDMNAASRNPVVMVRNAIALTRMVRQLNCDVIHAHGRAPGWSAYYASRRTGTPFLTTWYKGFREQNILKRLYNSVMVRGERVIAVGDQIAELIIDRYGTPWDRITVIPASIDLTRFDPARVSQARIAAIRENWGIQPDMKVILVVGRILRRKGHHIVIQAVRRLKEMGLKDFVCVFVGEDQGRTRYTGELWDLVLATDTSDVIRMAGPTDDLPAAFVASTVVVNAAIQPEGVQRAIVEAQAMAKPVVVSDLGAGPDVVLAPPAVAEDRMTGLRFSSADPMALAAALVRLFSLPDNARSAIGARGRAWVAANFSSSAAVEPTLRLYAEVARSRRT
jgi:glycosyltransferase involved in cell wall biosynthesis